MPTGDPVILGQQNSANEPTTLTEILTPVRIGSADTEQSEAFRVRGEAFIDRLHVKAAGYVEIPIHTSSGSIPLPANVDGPQIVLTTPETTFNGYVEAARVENGNIVVELSRPVSIAGIRVAYFLVTIGS